MFVGYWIDEHVYVSRISEMTEYFYFIKFMVMLSKLSAVKFIEGIFPIVFNNHRSYSKLLIYPNL